MSEHDPLSTDEPSPTIEGRVAQLLAMLDLAPAGDLRFTGAPQPGGVGRVFGGQVIAQGIVAANRTVDASRLLHSLHCYFMRAGEEGLPIDYSVEPDFDGGSFSTRRVVAAQNGRPILTMSASYHKLEPGFAHDEPMPNVPPPEDLMSEVERIEAEADPRAAAMMTRFQRTRPIEVRPVERRSLLRPTPQPALMHAWMRLGAPAGDDPALHRAILAYASDMMLLGTSVLPHGVNWTKPGMLTASLDHAMWIHDDVRMDDWLLYATDSPWAGRGRGFNRGRFFTRDGRLVASTAQEGLIRYRPPEGEKAPWG